jgi:hypothetical protein
MQPRAECGGAILTIAGPEKELRVPKGPIRRVVVQLEGGIPSGAEAPLILPGLMYGLKPVPFRPVPFEVKPVAFKLSHYGLLGPWNQRRRAEYDGWPAAG